LKFVPKNTLDYTQRFVSMDKAQVVFLGDISLNNEYIERYKKGLNPFSKIVKKLCLSNIVIGNLECMAKGSQGQNLAKKPRLTTTEKTLNYLNTLNVNLVSLAHNHIYDHLEDGFIKTTDFLHKNNIDFLGASLEKEKYGKPHIETVNDIKIGFLNYVDLDTNPNLPKNSKVFLNTFNLEKTVDCIKDIRKEVDHIVLLMHWGGRVEGGLYPDWEQPKIARQLIDSGADLIIGHHSHTIQPFEIYKGKHIFYSLGNFCFSDFCFEGKNYKMSRRRKNIIIPIASFSKTRYTVKISFWKNEGDEIIPYPSYRFKMMMRNNLFKLHESRAIWSIYFFIYRKISPILFYLLINDMSLYKKMKSLNWNKIRRYMKK